MPPERRQRQVRRGTAILDKAKDTVTHGHRWGRTCPWSLRPSLCRTRAPQKPTPPPMGQWGQPATEHPRQPALPVFRDRT